MIQETQSISWIELTERINGNVVIFIAGLFGFIWLIVRYSVFILSSPLLLLGLSVPFIGSRFSIYATPLVALAQVYSFLVFSFTAKITFWRKQYRSVSKAGAVFVVTLTALTPAMAHIANYQIPVVVKSEEVSALKALDAVARENDYIISWWDYGYYVKYFSRSQVIVDGGENYSRQLLPVAKILSAADDRYAHALSILITDKDSLNSNSIRLQNRDYLHKLASLYKFESVESLLKDIPELCFSGKTSRPDVYLYFPEDMLRLFGQILSISSKGYSGVSDDNDLVYQYFKDVNISSDGVLSAENGGLLSDTEFGGFFLDGKANVAKRYVQITHLNGQQNVQHKLFSGDGTYSWIHLVENNVLIFVNDWALQSLFFRLYLFGQYDPSLYTLVYESQNTKIYKLTLPIC